MGGYAYGALIVRVTGDTKPLRDDVKRDATAAGQDAAASISKSMGSGLKAVGGLFGAIGKSAVTGLGLASTAAIGFGVSAFKSAARVGEMDAALKALAKANKQSYPEMQKAVKGIRDYGIETGVAQQLVATFSRNQLDLSKSTNLARVAQDAAVISGRNSTEVLSDIVHGIETQNSMVLRNAGLNVQAGKAVDQYAQSVGKAAKDLTEAERAQAVLNAVLKEGESVAGAYSAAMKEPGKVLRSFPRLIDDIKVSVGQGLLKALGPAIIGAYDLAKAFSKAVEPGGTLAPIFDAIGVAVAQLVQPLTQIITKWAEWLANLKPEQVKAVVDVIKQFGPVLLIAAGALSAFTAGGVLTQIPILGGLFKSLLGPVLKLGPALLALPPPVLAVVAALGLLLAVSPKFRASVLELGRGLITALKPAFDAIVTGVKAALPAVKDLIQLVGDRLGPILLKLMPILVPLGQILGTVLAQAFQQVASAATALYPVLNVIFNVLEFLVGVLAPVIGWVLKMANGMLQAANAAGLMVSPLEIIVDVCYTVARAIQAVVRWIFGGSPGLIPGFLAAAAAAGPLMGVLRALAAVFGVVASAIAAAWSAVTSTTSAAWGAVKSIVSAGVGAVRSAVASGFAAVTSSVRAAMSAASSAVSSAFSAISGAARSGSAAVLSAVSSAFGQVRGVVQSAIGAVAGIVSSGLQAAVGAARSGGAAIMSGLQAGIQSAAGAVMSTISSVAGKVAGALSSALKIGSPSRLTIPMGAALAEGLLVGYIDEVDHQDWEAPHIGMAASPLVGPAPQLAGLGAAGGAVINVYPSAGQDERQLAAAVSRELAWAQAGGGG